MIEYLMWYKPLDSLILNKMEVLNESVIIILLYGLMCFTDFVPEEDTRSKIGIVYIGINVLHNVIHLICMLY